MLQCVVNGWCMRMELSRIVYRMKKVRLDHLYNIIDFILALCLCFIVREHYSSNKMRNAQVREDLPRAKVEQELETLKYQSYIQQQLVFIFSIIIY